MQLCIDAWLERKDPRIRLYDSDTGLEIVCLGPNEVREMVESGDICLSDVDNEAPCSELIDLLQDRIARHRDPTSLRLALYGLTRKRADKHTVGQLSA